jgi:hypothetical protein
MTDRTIARHLEWQTIETAPKNGVPFLAWNHDGEVWLAKFTDEGRLCYRTNRRFESTTYIERKLADGTSAMVRDDSATVERWSSHWTLWSRLYEFKPTHWLPLPSPPEALP